jgi:hypothetical protein
MPRRIVGALLLALSCAGCVRGCPSSRPPIHVNPNMDWQPRADPQEESAFFADGAAMRPPVPGTVARGGWRQDAALWTGRDAAGQPVARSPLAETPELLARGAARFAIYCQPCHDKRGNGRGILFERGGVPTPSFHDARVRALSDGEIFDVITQGKGLMQSYAYPVPPRDRWAIIAHVRRLQGQRLAEAGAGP